MEFTSIERISIANILIEMMNVDNDVDVREVLYFNQIQNVMNITNDEFKQGKEQNVLISLLTIKSMSDIKKCAVGKMLIEMIEADGKVDEQELKLFNLVCQTTGLNEAVSKH